MKDKQFYFTFDGFYPGAKKLRSVFDERFKDPRIASPDRFAWDYWHIPDQYTLVRTPAYHYFPKKIYEAFHVYLRDWGRSNLGCFEISPPWLSYYVEGCGQELHADVPHGPWAFVFALTPTHLKELASKFTGGETLIMRPEILDFWRQFDSSIGLEKNDIVDRIPTKFNRLTVFDPRFPHGVTEVKGTKDPREARLVIHGWFTEPRPFLDGPMPIAKATSVLNEVLPEIQKALVRKCSLQGTLAVRLTISASGDVKRVQVLADTLIPSAEDAELDSEGAVKFIAGSLKKIKFPKTKGQNLLTIPFLFR